MSGVPRQVKAQGDRAREMIDQVKKAQQEAGAAAEEVAASQATPPAPGSSSPGPTAEPLAQPTPPAPPAAPPLEEDWKHKYEVLQGKYTTEVPQLSEELRRTRGLVEHLQNELELLKKTPPAQEPPKAPSMIAQDEIDEFGPELYNFIRRAARAELMPEIESRMTKVQETAETAATTAAESARQRFIENLKADEDYHKYNRDKGFLQWLSQIDPLSGQTRQSLLDAAVAANDAARTLAFFKAYKAGVEPPQAVTPSVTPPSAPEPPPSPADFVSPGGTPPTAPAAGEKKIWTRKEVDDFFQRGQRQTKYSNLTPEQAEKVRAEITAATAEGRIQL